MRICLVIPPSPFLLDERVFVSLGLLRVAAALEAKDIGVEVLDLSGIRNYAEVAAIHARASGASIFGLTATSPQLPAATEIRRAIKLERPDAHLVLGGPHVTMTAGAARRGKTRRGGNALEQLLTGWDQLVAGDGESAILAIARGMRDQLVDADHVVSPFYLKRGEVDTWPMPARHLLDLESYHYAIDGERATSLIGQLGCPMGCSFSVTGDTMVFTERGLEMVRDLASGVGEASICEHGSAVLSYEADRHVATLLGAQRARVAVAEGMRPVYCVEAECGYTIKGTAEHLMLVAVDDDVAWKPISSLKPGDHMVVRAPEREWPTTQVRLGAPTMPEIPPGGFERKQVTLPSHLDPELAWLCGFLVGDGSIPSDGRPSVHFCVFPDLKEKLCRIVREKFGVELAVSRASNTTKMEHGWLHGRAARELFVQVLGIDPRDKLHVPALVWQSPKEVLQAFIDGLFDADAYVPKDGKAEYLTTSSRSLAREVQMALLLLGRGLPFLQEVESKVYKSGVSYRVGYTRRDRIPSSRCVYKSVKSGSWYWRTKRAAFSLGVKRSTLKESGLSHPLDRPGWYYVKVKAVEARLTEAVYDLKVDEEHCFVANGLVAHNCGGRNNPSFRVSRPRRVPSVVAEVEHLYREYGYKGFMFYDDELNIAPSMVELFNALSDLQSRLGVDFRLRGFVKSELFTKAQAEAMYRAGFRWLLCGFESGSDRILDNINKKATRDDNTRAVETARAAGLKIKALMSLGQAGETPETIAETERWLCEVQPDDFDATVITVYPGSPYYDDALPADAPGAYVFAAKNGDRLYAQDIDWTKEAAYYKGDPNGGYVSFVWTDALSSEELVRARDALDRSVRGRLQLPWPTPGAARSYEHSMGQLGPSVLRRSR